MKLSKGYSATCPQRYWSEWLGLHRIDRVLEAGVLGRDFAPQFVGRFGWPYPNRRIRPWIWRAGTAFSIEKIKLSGHGDTVKVGSDSADLLKTLKEIGGDD